MKTSELIGAQLDWVVARCEGREARLHFDEHNNLYADDSEYFDYSTAWEMGGPIIEREGIDLNYSNHEGASGEVWDAACEVGKVFGGETPLVAAMRCLVASQLGDEVEIPEELR